MLNNNNAKKNELLEEPALTEVPAEEESLLEDEFEGPMNALELENDEFDDWNPDLEKIQHLSKPSVTSKPVVPFLSVIDKIAIPTKFICPLSKQIMVNPVRIAGSKVPVAYEESAIASYYDEHGTDPMTHEDLSDDVHFIPDFALTREISDFCLAHEKSAK